MILSRVQLEVGDYIFDGELAFERKTYADLLGSMVGQKLNRQLIDMKDKYRYAVLIIEKSHIPIRRKGKKVKISTASVVFEHAPTSIRDQITQKRRTVNGALQILYANKDILFKRKQ